MPPFDPAVFTRRWHTFLQLRVLALHPQMGITRPGLASFAIPALPDLVASLLYVDLASLVEAAMESQMSRTKFSDLEDLERRIDYLAKEGKILDREAPGGVLAFQPAPAPSDAEVAAALATIRQRVQRLLVRRGLEPGDAATGPADPLADESPIMAGIVGASVQGRVALGSRAGARVRRLGDRGHEGGACRRRALMLPILILILLFSSLSSYPLDC